MFVLVLFYFKNIVVVVFVITNRHNFFAVNLLITTALNTNRKEVGKYQIRKVKNFFVR